MLIDRNWCLANQWGNKKLLQTLTHYLCKKTRKYNYVSVSAIIKFFKTKLLKTTAKGPEKTKYIRLEMLLNARADLHDLHKANLYSSKLNNCLSRPYPFKLFKGCLPQILLGSLLNTLSLCSKCNIRKEKKHLRLGERLKITMIVSSSHWFKINNYQVQCQETNKISLLRLNISLMTSTDW